MKMDRREFLKAGALALGSVAVTEGLSSVLSQKNSVSEAAGVGPVYEIYALKYAGPFTGKLALFLNRMGWDESININFYIWAIKGKDETIVVDTGSGITLASKMKLKNYVNPVDVLARIGINATNVTRVVITHMHYDHVGGMEMFPQAFPKATFYVQEKELDFWVRNPCAKRALFDSPAAPYDNIGIQAVSALKGTRRLVVATGNEQILPGIELLFTPGHTIGLQAVVVNTAKGTAIVASDNAHIARSFREDRPSSIATDYIAWLESYDKLRARASSIDLIFPGHDVMMLEQYPRVAEDVTRLV